MMRLTDAAATRIKDILSKAEGPIAGLVWDLKDFPQPGPLARKATRVR